LSGTNRDDAVSQAAKPLEDVKQLELSNDELIQKKAFIWVCGNNNDGELGLGNEEK